MILTEFCIERSWEVIRFEDRKNL